MPGRTRLDAEMHARGLVSSRAKAQALIMARRVKVNDEIVDKAGTQVTGDDFLEIVELEHPWVGRGGMKLDRALDHFELAVEGLTCADVGASTGGFTDVLLSRGARRVYSIDVGYGQLDQKLREDPRVVVMERTNARHLQPGDTELLDLVSIDVSFISLELIIPAVIELGRDTLHLIALIKPQFEAGRGKVGKGGIVKDPEVRKETVEKIASFTRERGLEMVGVIESPIRGAEGNVEYLMYARR
ncbi:MAG: TlyA family RNA methyltransferase [Thermoanaerobaculia bacterium]|nr:TlyA family RNA methyltransferase [Thermoanaerobaculia bacterium]